MVAESPCLSCTWRASFHFVPFGFLVFRLCHISRDAWTCFLLTQSLTFCVTDDSRVVWINEMKFASLCRQRYLPPYLLLPSTSPPFPRAMCLLFAIRHLPSVLIMIGQSGNTRCRIGNSFIDWRNSNLLIVTTKNKFMRHQRHMIATLKRSIQIIN